MLNIVKITDLANIWQFEIEDSCFTESGSLFINPIPPRLSYRSLQAIAVVKTYSKRNLNVASNLARVYLRNRTGDRLEKFKNLAPRVMGEVKLISCDNLHYDLSSINQVCMPSINFSKQYYKNTLRYIKDF